MGRLHAGRPGGRPLLGPRRGHRPAQGRAAISVRFLGAVGCATVTVPLADIPSEAADRPRANFVDDHVNRTLDELRLDHAPRADDATYLRRARLDLTGQLPSPAEVAEFLADRTPEKHARLVERLLASPEFVDHWAYKWGDLLRIESGRLGPAGAAAFHAWVRDAVARNTPLDRMAREMILALGDGDRVGPANFSRVASDARSQAELVSQVVPGRAAPVRQLPRPPARPLDPRRLPRPGRRLRPGRPGPHGPAPRARAR